MMGRGSSQRAEQPPTTQAETTMTTTSQDLPVSGGGIEMMESLYVPISSTGGGGGLGVLGSGSVSAPISPLSPPPTTFFPLHGPRASSVPICTSSSSSSTEQQAYLGYDTRHSQQLLLQQAYPSSYMQGAIDTPSTYSTATHIPNIVIDQVSARDAYGHSRTPPFVMPPLSQWQLGIPGNGRKNRTNSDSALYKVEKQQQHQREEAMSLVQSHMSPSVSSEGLHLEHIRLSDSPSTSPVVREAPHFTYQQPSYPFMMSSSSSSSTTTTAEQFARQVSGGFEVPMERDIAPVPVGGMLDIRPVVSMETGGSEVKTEEVEATGVQEEAMNLQYTADTKAKDQKSGEPPPLTEKQTVPFIWKFQPEKVSRSHSPKTYWIRRHSDSTLQTEPQNLTVSHDVQQRSHSTGESYEVQKGTTQKTGGQSGESFRSSLSESTEATEQTDTTLSAKRMKLKKTLLKRYQLQSEESLGSGHPSLDSDDVFSPSPGVFTTRTFSFSPERIHGLQSSTTGGDSPARYQSEAGREDPLARYQSEAGREDSPSHGAIDLSHCPRSPVYTKGKPSEKGGVGRPIRPLTVRTTTSSVSSEDPETPVFFSPSIFSPRSATDSPRHSGSVFQFHSPTHSRSPSLEKSSESRVTHAPFQPSPLTHEPHSPMRPPFRRSPSPLSQEPPPVATSAAQEGIMMSTTSGDDSSTSVAKQRGTLSPRDPQSPLVPRVMPTIREHSHPQTVPYSQALAPDSSTRYSAAHHHHSEGRYSPSYTGKPVTEQQQQHSPYPQSSPKPIKESMYISPLQQQQQQKYPAKEIKPEPGSSPYETEPMGTYKIDPGGDYKQEPGVGYLSRSFPPPVVGAMSFRGPGPMSELTPITTLEVMLRHPSFTQGISSSQQAIGGGLQPTAASGSSASQQQPLVSPQQQMSPYPPKIIHPSAQSSRIQTAPFQRYSDFPKASSGSGMQQQSISPMQQQPPISRAPHEPPFQSYSGTSSLPSQGGPSGTEQMQWAEAAVATATTGKRGEKAGDASKIIYCPFSEKVQEQRYQQDPHQSFVCPVCSQMFPSFNYLANHMVNHLPSETVTKGPGEGNKIHICKVCNKSFSRSDMLTRHMRLHTGLRPYECRLCGQVFSRSDHLNTHTRTHTGEKPYRCPQCPYAAPRRDMITRHMRIHSKQKRGRRNSSTGSADTQQSSFSSQESADSEKRRNQSLSSLESVDFPMDPTSSSHYRRRRSLPSGGDTPPTPDYYSSSRSRHWSLTSGESLESGSDLPPTPSTPGSHYAGHWDVAKKRSWSATSVEGESSTIGSRGDRFSSTEGDTRIRGERFSTGSELYGSGGDRFSSTEGDTTTTQIRSERFSTGSEQYGSEMQSSTYDESVHQTGTSAATLRGSTSESLDTEKSMDTEGTGSTLVSSGTSEEMSPGQISLQKCHVTGESSPSSGSDTARTSSEYQGTTERTPSEYQGTTSSPQAATLSSEQHHTHS